MEFNKGKQFLDSINVYSHIFRGNGFTAGIIKNEIEKAFSENSKYRDSDFDLLFDLAREFVNELNENSNKHSFDEIERFYNNKLELFYTDLKDIFFIEAEINKNFNEKTGTFGNKFNDNLKAIIIGIHNTYQIIFDGLKQYFDIPISCNILKEFYPFEHKTLTPKPISESPFSVLEWATIFYYSDETKLLPKNPLLKNRMEQFMETHQLKTTYNSFKTKYYQARKRINDTHDYPINKLKSIIPFLKENYKQTVTKVENDITFLEENKTDY